MGRVWELIFLSTRYGAGTELGFYEDNAYEKEKRLKTDILSLSTSESRTIRQLCMTSVLFWLSVADISLLVLWVELQKGLELEAERVTFLGQLKLNYLILF